MSPCDYCAGTTSLHALGCPTQAVRMPRDNRHHEVFLKALDLIGLSFGHTAVDRARLVQQAREIADLAYPEQRK